MKKVRTGVAALAVLLGSTALASTFTMTYCVTPENGMYRYDFTLTCDNSDNLWHPGYGLGWIVFGDAQFGEVSPLDGFQGDMSSLPAGPFYMFSTTGGGHNGPNLGPVVVQEPPYPALYWMPTGVGDAITWSGWHVNDVPQDQMKWSTVLVTGGASIQFETIVRDCGGPACGTADYDGDGDAGTDADIESFFSCLAGNCCATCWHMGADFNGDGDAGTDADIEAFFRVLAGNHC